jgi:hypothetical protein
LPSRVRDMGKRDQTNEQSPDAKTQGAENEGQRIALGAANRCGHSIIQYQPSYRVVLWHELATLGLEQP